MKHFFTLALCFLSISALAQNLTFDQLLLLSSKSQAGVDSYLESKGWEQAPAAEGADYTWAFAREIDSIALMLGDGAPNKSKPKFTASSWLNMLTMEGYPAVVYDILSSAKYQAIKKRAAFLGFKRISFKQDTEKSVSCYAHGAYKVYVVTKFDGDRLLEANSYSIAIINTK